MKKAMMLSIMVFLSTNVAAVALADSTIGSEVSLAVDFAPNLGSGSSFQGIMIDEGAMDLAADRTRTRTRVSARLANWRERWAICLRTPTT